MQHILFEAQSVINTIALAMQSDSVWDITKDALLKIPCTLILLFLL